MSESNPELRARLERFSLVRAAQRALARCLHPVALEPLQDHARQLLIQLKMAGGQQAPADGATAYAEIDELLTLHLRETLALIGKLEFSQLQAAGQELCREKPDELRALVDVMLMGANAQDRTIRRIEYLVTMMCVEEEAGRRSQVCEPSELTPGLRQVARRKSADPGIDVDEAVARLEEGIRNLAGGDEQLALRDGIRRFKAQLGAGLLHPRVLAAAVAYNVGMANHVAARIDGMLALDLLAEDLLGELKQPEIGDGTLLQGHAVNQLRRALRARVVGTAGDGAADGIVAAFELSGLAPREIEALENTDEDPIDGLIVSAVVLGCLLRQRKALAEPLKGIGLEPERLEGEALPALLGEFAAASSKLSADSGFAEAFVLSEVKARNLSALQEAAERRGRTKGDAAWPASASTAGRALPFGSSPLRLGIFAGAVLGLLVGVLLYAALGGDTRTFSPSELAEISPFLDSGHQRSEDGEPHFVGHLFPTWAYLATPQREAAAVGIADRFRARGIHHGVLLLPGPREMVRWEDGKLTEFVPKPAE
jgi:hypothetical protein